MNAFFASVEQAQRPNLKGKPVLVLSDPFGSHKGRRSVVAASSYEAKARGINSAMPVFRALELCPEARLIGGNAFKYLTTSLKIIEIFRKYTDLVEPYSIDEAFLDITNSMHLFGGAENVGRLIKQEIKEVFGITCSVGIAQSKVVAKMVSDWQKPDGLTVVKAEDIPYCLWHLPVDEIPGIGRRRSIKLGLMGINTIGELADYPLENLRRAFGIVGEYLYSCAWGHDDSPVDPDAPEAFPKSVSLSCTLQKNIEDAETLKSALLYMTDKLAWKLRKKGITARVISAGVRYSDYRFDFRQKKLSFFTNDTELIYRIGEEIYKELTVNRSQLTLWMPVRLVGVCASWLDAERGDQPSLFPGWQKKADLFRAVDGLKKRFGGDAVFPGSILRSKKLFEHEQL